MDMDATPRRARTRVSPLTTALAARLRMLAAERMLNQADVVRATGFNKKQVSLFWRGLQTMDVDEAEAVFEAVGADFAEQWRLARADVREWRDGRPGDAEDAASAG